MSELPFAKIEGVEDRSRVLWFRVLVGVGLMLAGYAVGAAKFYDACIADKYSPATCTKSTKQIYGWSILR